MVTYEIQGKLSFYVDAFEEAKRQVGDAHVAAVLVQELAKDARMNQIQKDRQSFNEGAATNKQIEYLRKLGVQIPLGLNKKEASEMIDGALAEEKAEF